MIYITGDTHGDIDFSKIKRYFKNKYITENDYLIILGDAGIVWSEEENFIYSYACIGLTVLFIDGNHENFELLNMFPIVDFKGAKCHQLSKNVFHILRGEVLNINGLSFFCMGGATSIDKSQRINRVSWWEEENISNKDIINGLDNLEKVNYNVDYVLTHCAPSFVVKKMFNYCVDNNTEILEKFHSQISFKHWYFGHYHENKKWKEFRCFYGDILEIIKTNEQKVINYPVLVKRNDGKLYNPKTGRAVNIKVTDLPEWYYEARGWFYSLKNVTDVAFIRSWTDNHLDKDASVYLHYHGKLKKNKLYEPLNEDEWDDRVWRGHSKTICYGLEKYSPHLNLTKLKAAINLNYDHYNQRNEFLWFKDDIVVRPFPEIQTPHYTDKHSGKTASYTVYQGDTILSDFFELDFAIAYADIYVSRNLGINITNEIIGNENNDFVRIYDTGHDMSKWVYIRRIEKNEN